MATSKTFKATTTELDFIIRNYVGYQPVCDTEGTTETESIEYNHLNKKIKLEKIDGSDCRITYYLPTYVHVVYITCSILFIWTILAPLVMMSYYAYISVVTPKKIMGMIEEHLNKADHQKA
ncbi:MAG: hypothetical protein H6667_08860 [Ardenticatenaceae bacterium]|nr:hypothetical protein [Ardenticatenaceae bacterium]MCB9445338.1 hypothetical protein [Ardenticatenaceae bacterium]